MVQLLPQPGRPDLVLIWKTSFCHNLGALTWYLSGKPDFATTWAFWLGTYLENQILPQSGRPDLVLMWTTTYFATIGTTYTVHASCLWHQCSHCDTWTLLIICVFQFKNTDLPKNSIIPVVIFCCDFAYLFS